MCATNSLKHLCSNQKPFFFGIIRSVKQDQNKNDDCDKRAADCESVRAKNVHDSDECTNHNQGDNDDDDEHVNSDNATMKNCNIQTDDVPDSQNTDQISLDVHECNAKQCTTNVTTDIQTTHRNDDNDDSANSCGGHELKQKQWHRRLHTPVWARCSIKNKNKFNTFFQFCFVAFYFRSQFYSKSH